MDAIMIDIPEAFVPGAGFNFEDVTDVFKDAGAVMDPGSFVFMDDLTLYDAMGAFEIGEPRLDSGLIAEDQATPPFNPTAPLLPQELCWIMDRAFAYEMEWHSGNPLCHSVFALLYIHVLPDIDLEFVDPQVLLDFDASRRPELIFQVLRSWVMGLLKCCDLSWRELSKGGVQDMEDWQGDKCDISLLEGTPVKFVLSSLEDANLWLQRTTSVPLLWRNGLRARINFRKALLQILQADVFSNPSEYQNLVDTAREQLSIIRSHPSSQPEALSPALHAFDPCIARRLKTIVPIRVLPLPSIDDTWKAYDRLLDGWQEVALLAQAHSLSTWEIVGNLRIWLPDPPLRIPYLRSHTQLIIPHIRGLWLNPPRRRRHLVNSLLDWHRLYDMLNRITRALEDTSFPKENIAMQLPKVPLMWRLTAIRGIIFSGFQLELFSLEERPYAYYYASRLIEDHLSILDDLLFKVAEDTTAHQELSFQHQFLTALQQMTMAIFVNYLRQAKAAQSSMSLLNFDSNRMRPAFFRRYKWAFESGYDEIQTPPVGHPTLYRLLSSCADIYEDKFYSPSGSISMARDILSGQVAKGNLGGYSSLWATDRLKFLRHLIGACDRLRGLPSSVEELEHFDVKSLKWDVQVHPWFPFLTESDAAS
ncbi:hypothetical protein H0H92_010336 [Tricholoma furcatifolium]|nr:hypothetical protein H0H92_010336 [Tricholoma furcatifolium]